MPYYHNENKEPTTNTAQTSSENGVEFKHLGTNLSQLCCADSYDRDMKFVVSLQAVFSIFININTTFLKLIHSVKYQSLINTYKML
jgi:hypothetical protein